MPPRACTRQLSFAIALSALALAAHVRASPGESPKPQQQQAQPQNKPNGKRPAAELVRQRPPAPLEDPRLELTRLWDGRKIELGPLDPRLHQVAVRGSLAVAPARGQLLVIDAAAGEIVRTLEIPGARSAAPLGVVLDGDFAVFATEDGFLAKLSLDGTYAWVVAGVAAVAPPLVVDIDEDGTNDVVVVSPTEIGTWNGINGSPQRRFAADNCTEPQARIAPTELPAVTISCGDNFRTFNLGSDSPTGGVLYVPDTRLDLVVGDFGGPALFHFQRVAIGTGVVPSAPDRSAYVDGDRVDWTKVATLSSDDIDGDGLWDLLVVSDRALVAYATRTAGRLYQAMPFAARGFGMFDSYLLPAAGDNAERFRPAPPTAVEGFQQLADSSAASAFPDSWPAAEQTTPLGRRPLLRDVQSNPRGEYAHDGLQFLAGRKEQGAYSVLPLPAAPDEARPRQITGLAVATDHVVLAYADRLVACDGNGTSCRIEGRRRIRSVAGTPSDEMFWAGTSDGMLVSYDASSHQFGREISVKQIGSVSTLARVGQFVVASGPKGTQTYRVSGHDALTALSASQVQLQRVVQCHERGSYYALSNGELLEAGKLTEPFKKVQAQPSAVRALGCDANRGLVVLSAERGSYTLRAPFYSGWPAALLAIVGCSAVLLFVWNLSYRRPKRTEQTVDESVRLGIRTDLPLTSLPAATESKLADLVRALVRFIDNEDTQPPITIGVYGPWGSGKSSAMRLVQRELEATRRYISVWFNPWRFHREKDIAAALLQSVVQEVRDRAGLGRVNIALQRLLKAPALAKLAWFVPLVLISFHMYHYPHMWPPTISLIGKEILSTELAGGSLLTLTGFAGLLRFFFAARKVFEFNPAELLGERNQEKRVDFIRHFSEELKEVLDALPRAQQVVLFVDDLDRCPPDQTLAMLEALQLLTESQRCYFVLGMDQSMVRSAIELKYNDLLELKQRRGEDTSGFGAHYLEKIITLAVHVPRVQAVDVETAPRVGRESAAAVTNSPESRTAWISATQAFLLGWLLLCTVGFAFLFSVSAPALPSRPAAPETTASAATTPVAPAGVKRAPERSETPTNPQGDATLRWEQVRIQNALEAERAKPPAAVPHVEEVAGDPADHDYTASRNELVGLIVASWIVCTTLLALAAVLYHRLRSVGPLGPPAKDSPEFNAALCAYLAHLPCNPRKLIRSGNIARFMYYLVASADAARSPVEFFACLLAEQQLRPIVGDDVPASVLAEAVAERAAVPRPFSGERERVERVYAAWRQDGVAPLQLDAPINPEFCEELRSWLQGTHAGG